MEVTEHYIQLRLIFPHVHEEEEVEITMGVLATHLCCTMRNMNLIMNKFLDNGWVRWSPQRGRGKKSILVFRLSLQEVAGEWFERLLHNNKIEEAYTLAASLPFLIRENVMRRLQSQFGLRSDQSARGRVDTLRIPQETSFETLDPTQAVVWGDVGIVAEVFDRLVRYNAERDVCEPGLAMAWESNPEGTEWTFYLHKGVLFHHGRVLEAEDVQYTFERILSSVDNPCKTLFGSIQMVETFDELTVRFVLKAPNFMFPDLMSSINASILPRDVEINPLHPIGTGPYRLVRNDPNILVLEVFSSYFRGRAFIDRVEVWQLPEAGRGESVIRQELFPDGNPHAVQHEVQGGVFMTFNMRKRGPHLDLSFRRAIRELMHPQEMADALNRPAIQSTYRLVRKHNQGNQRDEEMNLLDAEKLPRVVTIAQQKWNEVKEAVDVGVDVDKGVDEPSLVRATAWLKRSHYAGEMVNVWVEEGVNMEHDMVWFAKRCEQIGLHVNIVPGDVVKAIYHDELQAYDLIYTGEVFDDHVVRSLITMYTFQKTLFLSVMDDHWRHELERGCDQIVAMQEPEERMESLLQLEDRLIQEAILLPVYSFSEVHSHHPSLRDYRVMGYGMPDLRRLWVKRSPTAPEESSSYSAYIPLW